MAEDMVIFTRTFDLLSWLLPASEKFPKAQRFVVTKRLTDAALNFQEALFDANAQRGVDRLAYLRRADAHLHKVRLYLRLSYQWHWLNAGQYEHVSKMIEEIGRLLGGWLKQGSKA
jgi:23S rRNA-intervening sequence protein